MEWGVCLLCFFGPLVTKRPPKDHIAARMRVAHTHHTHQARAVCHVTRQDNKTDAPPEAHPQQTNDSVGDCRPNQQSEHASTTERRLNHPTASVARARSEAWRGRQGGCPKTRGKLPASGERPRSRADRETWSCAAVKTCSVRGTRKKTRVRYLDGCVVCRTPRYFHPHSRRQKYIN